VNDGAEGEAETAIWNNTGTATRTVFIIVSLDGAPGPGETFSLAATLAAIQPPPPGDVCATATALSPGTAAGTTSGFYDDYHVDNTNGDCGSIFDTPGPERVYSLSVPSGQLLTATLTPHVDGGFGDAAMYLLGGTAAVCTATITACLEGADDGFDEEQEIITWRNDAGTAQNVFLIVDNYLNEELQNYTLQTTIVP
jgi:hypothetical protein